jgi:hypothetical protein
VNTAAAPALVSSFWMWLLIVMEFSDVSKSEGTDSAEIGDLQCILRDGLVT